MLFRSIFGGKKWDGFHPLPKQERRDREDERETRRKIERETRSKVERETKKKNRREIKEEEEEIPGGCRLHGSKKLSSVSVDRRRLLSSVDREG